MKSLSRVRLLATPWTVAYQAPPSMGFSRQEYWSGVPLPSPKLVLEQHKKLTQLTLHNAGIKGILQAAAAMAPHSSTLAWKIPWTEEPRRLQSMGSLAKSRTRLSDFTFTFHSYALEKEKATHSSVLAWRIPGTGSLVGCRLWGRTESDTTEAT